ncbi:nucleotide sugar dehydrogenase [Kaistella sp. DKR-2]|uniref:nucleotide sugar dehydrogenase n=1 Tax=Kaistella soli TaxID=2849654 RepID=UPI001C27CB6B|nr:nucleotide sugar dehydrogenase [Kaistella soli]MBU8883080.1 nucleotide sugar dehydrogenase [Kaistella soli]
MENAENIQSIKIAIIGLGYVGLPLARLFATQYPVIGFDIDSKRIGELNSGTDKTLEVEDHVLQQVLVSDFETAKTGLICSSNVEDIAGCNYYIVTVPTPVDKNNRPDLSALYHASETVGSVLKKGDIVIYESTVYPGVTEEECVPVLEKFSGLKFNVDFFCGYSPERINPGDREKTVEKIMKVTSGSTPETAQEVDALYRSVITAGTHLAPSIKVAEASKVIENAQRDINIAFVNELAKIFALMDLDTHEVLKAAGTKWNFLPFTPGLVGGHCIGVDPFYLAQKAQDIGYYSELILTARRVNDSMGGFIANQVVKAMIKKNLQVNGAEVLMLGITFKENCGDVRNTKIVDVVCALKDYGINVTITDPWADAGEVHHEYGLEILRELPEHRFDAVILGVAHQEFLDLDLSSFLKENGVVYDVKGVLKHAEYRL